MPGEEPPAVRHRYREPYAHYRERVVVVDSRGQLVDEYRRELGRPGEPLTLTIDLELQRLAEELMAGQTGSVVALDPRNGEIRALVSHPSFDPNLFARRLRRDEWRELVEDTRHPLQNRAIQSVYSPGSVFKPIVALAALAEGVVATRVNNAFRWSPPCSPVRM